MLYWYCSRKACITGTRTGSYVDYIKQITEGELHIHGDVPEMSLNEPEFKNYPLSFLRTTKENDSFYFDKN